MKIVNAGGIPPEDLPSVVADTLLMLGREGFRFDSCGVNLGYWIEEITFTHGPDPRTAGTITTARILVIECQGYYIVKRYVLEAFWQYIEEGFGCYGLDGVKEGMKSFKR